MANYANLKATINANIKANGTEAITGPVLNSVLTAAVNTLGAGYQFMGVATTSTNPGTPDANVFYIAATPGTYTNFGGKTVADGEVAILKYNGTWTKEVTGAATAAQLTQLGQEMGQLGQEVSGSPLAQTGNVGEYIYTADGIGALIDSSSVRQSGAYPGFRYYIHSCLPGERFIVNGTGTTLGALWAFLDANQRIISLAGANETAVNLELDVPENAAYIVINDRTGAGVSIYQSYATLPITSRDTIKNTEAITKSSKILISSLEDMGVVQHQWEDERIVGKLIRRASGLDTATVYDVLKYTKVAGRVYFAENSKQPNDTCAFVAYYNGATFLSSQYLPGNSLVSAFEMLNVPDNADTIYLCCRNSYRNETFLNYCSADRFTELEKYTALPNRNVRVIPLSYAMDTDKSAYDATDEATLSAHLQDGEYGMISPWCVYQKQSGSLAVAVVDSETLAGASILAHYFYTYAGRKYRFSRNVWSSRFNHGRLVELPTPIQPSRVFDLVIPDGANVIKDYPASDWDFTTDSDGNYTIMPQVYAKFDALALAHPSLIKKYDPMASQSYTEGGIQIEPITSIRNAMVSAGFSDYPVYAQGVATEQDVTIGGYSVHLLPTPAYKTFIYRIVSDSPNNAMLTGYPKRRLFIQAGLHSAEVISQICSALFAEELVSDNPIMLNILAWYDVWIVPCMAGYGGFHNSSLTPCGVNPNRNYVTPWWIQNDNIELSGLAAGDQFETRLSMCIGDYLKPDAGLDIHTLSNSIIVASSDPATAITRARVNQLAYNLTAIDAQTRYKLLDKFSSVFVNKPNVYNEFRELNGATAGDYFTWKGCESYSLLEMNNVMGGTPATLNSSELISAMVYLYKNAVFNLCKYNLLNCENRQL